MVLKRKQSVHKMPWFEVHLEESLSSSPLSSTDDTWFQQDKPISNPIGFLSVESRRKKRSGRNQLSWTELKTYEELVNDKETNMIVDIYAVKCEELLF